MGVDPWLVLANTCSVDVSVQSSDDSSLRGGFFVEKRAAPSGESGEDAELLVVDMVSKCVGNLKYFASEELSADYAGSETLLKVSLFFRCRIM